MTIYTGIEVESSQTEQKMYLKIYHKKIFWKEKEQHLPTKIFLPKGAWDFRVFSIESSSSNEVVEFQSQRTSS
jgi:hypothetical protein